MLSGLLQGLHSRTVGAICIPLFFLHAFKCYIYVLLNPLIIDNSPSKPTSRVLISIRDVDIYPLISLYFFLSLTNTHMHTQIICKR